MISLLVLDCDGVILDSMAIKTEAMRRVGEAFGPELRDRLVLFQQIEGGISRYEKFDWLWREAYGQPISRQDMLRLEHELVAHMEAALAECPLVPGTLEVLHSWHGKLPIYVCSGAPHAELNELLTKRGLGGYFTGICGYPPAKTPLLQQILTQSGANPATSLMVGDTITDSRAAQECGTLFFGIGSAFTGAAFPQGPDLHALNTWLHTAVTL